MKEWSMMLLIVLDLQGVGRSECEIHLTMPVPDD